LNNIITISDITTIDCKIDSNKPKIKNDPFQLSSLKQGNGIVDEIQEKKECKIIYFNSKTKLQKNNNSNFNENEDITISNKNSPDLIPLIINKRNFNQLEIQEEISINLSNKSYFSNNSKCSFENDKIILHPFYKKNYINSDFENDLLKHSYNNNQFDNFLNQNISLDLINHKIENFHNRANLQNLYQNFENFRNQFFLNYKTNNSSNNNINLNYFLSNNQIIGPLNFLHSNCLVNLVYPNTPYNLTLSNYKYLIPNFYQQ